MLNVALIRKDFSDAAGGAERYAVSLARGLAHAGHRIHVFAGTFSPNSLFHNDNPITYHRVPFLKTPSPVKNLSFQRNTRRLVSGLSFDIINGLSQVFPQDVYRAGDGLHIHWMRTRSPGSVSGQLQRFNPRHAVILYVEKQIFKPGNYLKIIANSTLCKDQICSYYKVPEDSISVIYNGVDCRIFFPAPSEKEKQQMRSRWGVGSADTVFLFAGNNFSRKGLQRTLLLLSAVKKTTPRVKLIICGRDNVRRFTPLLHRLGISDDVFFCGYTENIAAVYRSCDLLIHPSLYEPFSNVCLEAMACGLPVITTKTNGAHEIIRHGVSGLVFDPAADIANIACAVQELIQNRETLKEMAWHAAKTAETYSLSENIRKTLDVYHEVITLKKKQPL